MILVGNQRAGAKNMALHLLKDENDHVEIHQLRGFASGNLIGALNEIYAISKGTRCKQFMYSLSMNPPQSENVPVETFVETIERIEKKLGLSGQPRAIVFHEQNGRRHCHCVWSRIQLDSMTAINLPFTKNKLQAIARELFLENGWKMPPGLSQAQSGDLRNFTHEQWQQSKRRGIEPKALKAAFAESWAASDSQAGFVHALDDHGLIVARGDRRGFVAVDYQGEVYSIAKWLGIKAKDVRARLTDQDGLPSVDEAREAMKAALTENLKKIASHQNAVFAARFKELAAKRKDLISKQRMERTSVQAAQENRRIREQKERQARYRKGLRGFFDKLTGKSRKIRAENIAAHSSAKQRDRAELDALNFTHLQAVRILDTRMARLHSMREHRIHTLKSEMEMMAALNQENERSIDKKPAPTSRYGRANQPSNPSPSR